MVPFRPTPRLLNRRTAKPLDEVLGYLQKWPGRLIRSRDLWGQVLIQVYYPAALEEKNPGEGGRARFWQGELGIGLDAVFKLYGQVTSHVLLGTGTWN